MQKQKPPNSFRGLVTGLLLSGDAWLLYLIGGLMIWLTIFWETPAEEGVPDASASSATTATAAAPAIKPAPDNAQEQLERYEALERRMGALPRLDAKRFTAFAAEITHMRYQAEEFTLEAERAGTGTGFSIRVTRARQPRPERCPAPDALLVQLYRLAAIPITNLLEPEALAQRFPRRLGRLEIRDHVAGDPPAPMQFFATPDLQAFAVRLEPATGKEAAPEIFAAEVGLSAEVFQQLEAGCPATRANAPATPAGSRQ
ncbi:MAG: hypothetical protein LBO00_03210 [Zoogloeaceae bacterium]|jgi:hypothetical protein|nr:hypothetical protein [Zoogloeaceae bacterium]